MRCKGFTLVELLIVLGVVAILLGIAALDVRPLNNDARTAANEFIGVARLARSRAMGTTSAHRLVVADATTVRVEAASACADPVTVWEAQDGLSATFRRGAVFEDQAPGNVLTCYDTRGIANASPTVLIRDGRNRTATVEMFAGGGIELR